MISAGFHAAIRPSTPADLDFIQSVDMDADELVGWRFYGAVPNPSAREMQAWDSVFAQRVVMSASGGEALGYVTAYDANLRSGTVWIAAAAASPRNGSGAVVAGVAMFLNELFDEYPIRRCLLECPEDNLKAYRSLLNEGTFVQEGRLIDHMARPDGSFGDLYYLAVARDRWMSSWGDLVRRRVTRAAQLAIAEDWGTEPHGEGESGDFGIEP